MTTATIKPKSGGYRQRLGARIAATRTHLCVGIDPHVEALPPFFARRLAMDGPEAFLAEFSCALIDAAVDVAPAVKFQSAFFEAFGAVGFAVLTAMCARAKAKGLITILDAKRGDIASTMAAYGKMAFEVMDADALTVTPYVGLDVTEPLLRWLAAGRGIYLVWVTSNAGGALVQDLRLSDGQTVAHHIYNSFLGEFQRRGVTDAYGVVVGATRVAQLDADLRERLRHACLLMPGLGAQGGQPTAEFARVVATSPATLVSQSRSLSQFEPTVDSWRGYCTLVEGRVRTAAAELRVGG